MVQEWLHPPHVFGAIRSVVQPAVSGPHAVKPSLHVADAHAPSMHFVCSAFGTEHVAQSFEPQPYFGSVFETHAPLQRLRVAGHAFGSPASGTGATASPASTKPGLVGSLPSSGVSVRSPSA